MSDTMVTFRVSSGAATDVGPNRRRNEDAFLAVAPIFLVADGMGGHNRGDLASRTVVSSFEHLAGREFLRAEELVGAIEQASVRVRALSELGGAPGSTVTGVGLTEQGGMPCWLVFNIGDSRTYLLTGGALQQVSVDHSATATGPSAGRNVITRALGGGLQRPVLADQWLVPASRGDRVLICSDGLTNELTEQLIHALLLSEPEPVKAAERLVQAAIAAGGRDNVTAVVVEAMDVQGAVSPVTVADTTLSHDDTVPDEVLHGA